MKTIIMIALIAMSFSCVKQEVETEPKNDIFVGDSISQTLTSGGDTLYEASSREWYTTDRYGDSTCYSIYIKYDVNTEYLYLMVNHSEFENIGCYTPTNIKLYTKNEDKFVYGAGTCLINIYVPKYSTILREREIVKIVYQYYENYRYIDEDISLPSNMSNLFIEFFKKVKEYEDKN